MISLLLFAVTFIATVLSSMSGGGASVINIPVFLALGMPFPLATATQKLGSACWVLPAAYNYLKDQKVDWFFLIIFSVLGLIGSYVGVILVISLNPRILQIFIGILILLLVTYTYFQKDLGLVGKIGYSKNRQMLAYPFAILLGFYESIFGAGNALVFAIVSVYTKGYDFVKALGYYFAIAFLWVVFAAGLLIHKGYFDWKLMLPAVIGSVLGGYVGSKFAKQKGSKFIRFIYIFIGAVLGLKLLFGF